MIGSQITIRLEKYFSSTFLYWFCFEGYFVYWYIVY